MYEMSPFNSSYVSVSNKSVYQEKKHPEACMMKLRGTLRMAARVMTIPIKMWGLCPLPLN